MVTLFENPRAGDLKSHLANVEYRTRADAERVVAWIEKAGNRTLKWGILVRGGNLRNEGFFWIEATITVNGLSHRI